MCGFKMIRDLFLIEEERDEWPGDREAGTLATWPPKAYLGFTKLLGVFFLF